MVVETLVNTLVKVLVDTLANTLRASRRALPTSHETPYQPTAGLIGYIYMCIVIYIHDKLQCNMTAKLLDSRMLHDETIDHFVRRRKLEARNLCDEQGMWSKMWCKRVVDWNAHIRMGAAYAHICLLLLNYRDIVWLPLGPIPG